MTKQQQIDTLKKQLEAELITWKTRAEIAEQYNKNISERIEKLNHKLEEL